MEEVENLQLQLETAQVVLAALVVEGMLGAGKHLKKQIQN